ncbi:MAG: polyprenyl synthetase family protein [Actinomycetota bacterium]
MSGPSTGRLEGPPPAVKLVERQLLATEGYLLEVVTSDFPFVSVLAQHLLRAGGKRLRVALTFVASGFGDRDPAREEDVRKLAAAIELTHLATLQHDDIIDEADTRHGVPAVNANWTNTLAVLSGDYLFAKASLLAAEVGGECPKMLAETIAALCEGQVGEIENAFQTERAPEDYLAVIERKTARLFAASTYLGARVGGAEVETARLLERYAIDFGMAFQLVDDLLDFLGDEKKLGKPIGTDLKEGVYSLPVLHAMGERDDVAGLVKDSANLSRLIEVLHETGSFVYAREAAERYAKDASVAASALPDVPEREALKSLVDFVVDRIPVSSAA